MANFVPNCDGEGAFLYILDQLEYDDERSVAVAVVAILGTATAALNNGGKPPGGSMSP
jgi:hypothetical protein